MPERPFGQGQDTDRICSIMNTLGDVNDVNNDKNTEQTGE